MNGWKDLAIISTLGATEEYCLGFVNGLFPILRRGITLHIAPHVVYVCSVLLWRDPTLSRGPPHSHYVLGTVHSSNPIHISRNLHHLLNLTYKGYTKAICFMIGEILHWSPPSSSPQSPWNILIIVMLDKVVKLNSVFKSCSWGLSHKIPFPKSLIFYFGIYHTWNSQTFL
ncbi:hypothetical protein AAFF_G00285970 [Aldrovandia affinis]|uniref:Uncharacterized protein n=1 Tax=Aldrovandia affinis TaxID=143900 RepID=A0AAD7TAI0_9TELE|nr:hypothetical protein AAFF_G00285970 [Aldrovandia affinis]